MTNFAQQNSETLNIRNIILCLIEKIKKENQIFYFEFSKMLLFVIYISCNLTDFIQKSIVFIIC